MTDHSSAPAIRFASAYALLRMAADFGDQRVSSAEPVSISCGVAFRAVCGITPVPGREADVSVGWSGCLS